LQGEFVHTLHKSAGAAQTRHYEPQKNKQPQEMGRRNGWHTTNPKE